MRILIAVPTTGMINFMVAKYLIDAVSAIRDEGHTVRVMFRQNPGIDSTRNLMAKIALDEEYDKLFFIDSDVATKDPRDVLKLCQSNKDVICGIYPKRHYPIESVGYKLKNGKLEPLDKLEWKEDGLAQVDAIGTGFLCINPQIFKDLEKPWFQCAQATDTQEYVSEDIWFSERLHNAGYKIWVDPNVKCIHYGLHGYQFEVNK